jgi:hypothetical protein
MKLVLIVVLVCTVLYCLHRLARWAEDRGLIYYRRYRPSRSALGNAFLEVQTIVDPGKRLVLEARRQEPSEEDESGEPPPASDSDRADESDNAAAASRGPVLHSTELAARVVAADVSRCWGGLRPPVRTFESSRR